MAITHALVKCLGATRYHLAVGNLVGAAEIAQLLGVGRQRVQQLIKKPGFPVPQDELLMGKVWLRSDVESWAVADGRNIDVAEFSENESLDE